MPPQRQLAAIMFTDIVGFTFLMGKDENLGLSILETNRTIHSRCIEAHSGHFVKEIGDGILSWFSSAVDAIQCALAIQQGVSDHDYKLRIGIHLGDVVLREGDVFGNTVNIANRVESLVNPGAVFVTEQVVESIRGIENIKFTFLGEKSLKNVEPSVRIFGLEHPQLSKPELKVFLEDSIDQDVQQYHLMEKLGVGGMGIIYKALDTKLQRFVALKFLSSQLNRDEAGRERFLQEARAAAALQHARICTIYEIDETEEGRFFIAMELIEGPTLKEYLAKEGPLDSEQAIDLAIQLAEGLQHAHQAGIVHRDIKPENIKITPEGEVKILDFGLALSGDLKMRGSGQFAGTVAYMSPEQAQGEPVDHRSDIWSFGVVLYEMLTGRLPFAGEHNHLMIHAILYDQPESLNVHSSLNTTGLADLIHSSLEKETAFRTQTAADLLATLLRLRRDLSLQQDQVATKPTVMARLLEPNPRRLWLLPLVLLIALGLGWGFGTLLRPASTPLPTLIAGDQLSISPFTVLGGLSTNPTWSPEGAHIVYVSNEAGSMDLWKKPTTGGKAERLTTLPGNEIEPAWSPDGRNIAFRGDGGIFIIPAIGGKAFQLTEFGHSPSWSPDSRQLAFAANGNIYTVETTGGQPETLIEGTSSNPRPVWTADGQRILFWNRTMGDIQVINTSGENAQSLGLTPTGYEIGSLSLNKTGTRLLFSRGPFGGNKDLFEVLIDSTTSELRSAVRNLTITTTDDTGASYGPDGHQIAYTAQTVERQLYAFPLDPKTGLINGDSLKLTRYGKMNYYPELSPDGHKMLWTSHRNGQGILYSKEFSSDEVEKVTDEWGAHVREISGRFNPVSEQVIFASTRGGTYQLWRLPSIGSVGFALTETKNLERDVHPSISPNGKFIVFYSNRSGNWDIWKLGLQNGNKPRKLTDWPGNELYPVWSPDSRSLAFAANREGNTDIWITSDEGEDARPFVSSPAEELWCTWSPDQRWFYFVSNRGGSYNIWRVPGAGGEAQAVTTFNDPAFGLSENSIFTKFAVGDDQLILSLESRKGDIYLLNIAEVE